MAGVAELEPGEVFAGRYEIQRLLGEGDRKRTYLARDQKMDRQVAVSLVKPDAIVADPDGTEREAKVLGRIGSHANIVSLYDYEMNADGSLQYMVFEFLSGGTLSEHLKQTGQQSLDEILRFGRQLCRGLSHLHQHGLIHRDVSPDNVWLDERRTAHLGDFDSAITAAADDEVLRPITTTSFAAPEERDGRPLDRRSDLFSFGGVLHVVATGVRWPGDLTVLRSQRSDLPSSFGGLVASLLAPSPDDRPSDASHVLEQLDQIRRASDIEALIASGEGERVEFKSSLHQAHGSLPTSLQKQVERGQKTLAQAQSEVQGEIRKGITKTIAAFLNTGGGTLLIGVEDSGSLLGIEGDFSHLGKDKRNADGWLLSLRRVIINALGLEVWGAIHASLVRRGEKTVAVVHCPPRASETWHREDGGERFYMRTANATQELSGPSLVRYVRERWPK